MTWIVLSGCHAYLTSVMSPALAFAVICNFLSNPVHIRLVLLFCQPQGLQLVALINKQHFVNELPPSPANCYCVTTSPPRVLRWNNPAVWDCAVVPVFVYSVFSDSSGCVVCISDEYNQTGNYLVEGSRKRKRETGRELRRRTISLVKHRGPLIKQENGKGRSRGSFEAFAGVSLMQADRQ